MPEAQHVMYDSIDILQHPLLLDPPRRVVPPLAWTGHIPFARLLVELLGPQLIVELGTHSGNSYNAFCEAVDVLGLPTRCYAVDTWEGDPQSGCYGPEVYADLSAYQDSHYRGFSTLLRMRFDDALARFAPATIDLLHIDGLHTYEAVRHDFESWRPKVSRRGVVLFHDIAVQRDDFGVWRFWQELKRDYPFLEFRHCNGLGLIAVGPEIPERLRRLIDLDETRRQRFATLLERLGGYVTQRHEVQGLQEAMRARHEEIRMLHEASRTLRDCASERDRELAAMRLELDVAARRLDEALANILQLEARLAAREQDATMLSGIVADMRRSRSWRLTAPLRWCSRQRARFGALWHALRTGGTRDGR